MNVNPDSTRSPDDPEGNADGAEPVPKPARARRAAGLKTDAAAVPAPTEPASSSAVPGESAAPRRRRRKSEHTPDLTEGPTSSPDKVEVACLPAQVVAPISRMTPAAETPQTETPAPVAGEPVASSTAAQVAEAATPRSGAPAGEGPAGPAGEGPAGPADDGPRGRRRNRRDRKRRERDDIPSEGGAPVGQASNGEVPALAQAALVQAGELFAKVLSGGFDADESVPLEVPGGPDLAGDADDPQRASVLEAPAEAHKRVLAAEADAPKLHKVLAQAGIGSRRDMEDMILDGSITVNGEPAHVGQRISFGDQIKVNGKPVKVRIMPPPARLIAYHKPVGEIVTHDDPQNRPTVYRRLPRLAQGKWQSVGRLDINTEGLLLFTNSGELAHQLMHPRFGVEREYAVRVLGTLEPEAKERLIAGVEIEGQMANFRSIEEGGGEGVNRWYRVVIAEGRNREVRKLFDAVGLTVNRLIRIRYGCVVLPLGLRRGVWVDLDDAEVRAVRQLAGGGRGERAERGEHDERSGGRGQDRGGRPPKQRNDRGGGAPDRQRDPQRARPTPPSVPLASQEREPVFERDPDPDIDPDQDFDHRTIPNPLEQTFDKRFVQNPRSPAGGRGFGRGGGGFGAGGSAPPPSGPRRGSGPKEPDPLQTSVGYIGADAFHRKGKGGRGGGGGGFGGAGGAGGRRGR